MGCCQQGQKKKSLTASIHGRSFGIEGALGQLLELQVGIRREDENGPGEEPHMTMSSNEQCRGGTWREGKPAK